ncbi:MAG: hypoxanthine phosphoribosyltransferase [Paludibacteraceae bacterium]|nr:hypoxanthine phosphoribosyltransferase [Paludibacteraceae bacterium]
MVKYEGMEFAESISANEIQEAVNRVATAINADYAGREPLFVCVLNGAFMYASDLMKRITLPCEITFVRMKSYEGTETTGKVNMLIPLQVDVKGRDVIVIEDIVDTGITMHAFMEELRKMGAKSVELTSMLYKPESLRYEDVKPKYYGLAIPPAFIIGYGLDINEKARNLASIYTKV